ncbi:hypothetical protein [Streptomyces umbrinus]
MSPLLRRGPAAEAGSRVALRRWLVSHQGKVRLRRQVQIAT